MSREGGSGERLSKALVMIQEEVEVAVEGAGAHGHGALKLSVLLAITLCSQRYQSEACHLPGSSD